MPPSYHNRVLYNTFEYLSVLFSIFRSPFFSTFQRFSVVLTFSFQYFSDVYLWQPLLGAEAKDLARQGACSARGSSVPCRPRGSSSAGGMRGWLLLAAPAVADTGGIGGETMTVCSAQGARCSTDCKESACCQRCLHFRRHSGRLGE